MNTILSEYALPIESPALAASAYRKWRPTELLEWAKLDHSQAKYNLTASGIPQIQKLSELPGGPYEPDIRGPNEWGHPGLKETISAYYDAQPDNILTAQGASQCNFLIAGALLSGGGSAIVETPVYQPILRGIEVWADRIYRLPRRRENRFLPDLEEFERLLTSDVRLVSLTNLHNPTAAWLPPKELSAIVELAARYDATVMVDEVYLAMLDRDYRNHAYHCGAISTNSLDKSWALSDLRVGWAVGPAEIIHKAYRLNNLMGANQAFISEDLAWRILQKPEAVQFLADRARQAQANRPLFDDFLKRTPRAACVAPPAGISAMLELPAGIDDQSFADDLLARHSLLVFPASLFEAPGCIRVSFGGDPAMTKAGLEILSQEIQAL